MIVAVDGPAASGKGTIAKALARHYGLPHLDTGLLYRAVAATVRAAGDDPRDEAAALAACGFADDLLDDPALRDDAVGQLASVVSAHPAVRAALCARQEAFARQPGGAVLDGRDIGTVIAPTADAKLFVTASAEVRAQRRYAEAAMRGDPAGTKATFEAVLNDIRARDARDRNRAAAPLVQAADAVLLDTSDLGIADSVAQAIALVDARRPHRP